MAKKRAKKPSQLFVWFLTRMKRYESDYSVSGDFLEYYNYLRVKEGRGKANLWCFRQILVSLLPYLLYCLRWRISLFKSYLKISMRNIAGQKIFSFINISGLAVGTACTILILLWVQDELNYDRFHENSDNIFKLISIDKNVKYAISHAPLGETLKNEFPEILNSTRITIDTDPRQLKYENNFFKQTGKFADPDFFEIFSFFFIEGNPQTALYDPYSIVLTEDLAQKLFGEKGALGKIVNIDNSYDFSVTGVIKDIPKNSHLKFDFLRSFEFFKARGWTPDWNDHSYYSYILLRENFSASDIKRKINICFKKYKPESSMVYDIQPLTGIHLNSNFRFDIESGGNIRNIYIFTGLAVLILVIASINFMNLSIARSSNRMKEIGIKKVLGAFKKHIAQQFLCESILMSLFAVILAVVFVVLVLPVFNGSVNKEISADIFLNRTVLTGLFALILLTGIIAGLYPLFICHHFVPPML